MNFNTNRRIFGAQRLSNARNSLVGSETSSMVGVPAPRARRNTLVDSQSEFYAPHQAPPQSQYGGASQSTISQGTIDFIMEHFQTRERQQLTDIEKCLEARLEAFMDSLMTKLSASNNEFREAFDELKAQEQQSYDNLKSMVAQEIAAHKDKNDEEIFRLQLELDLRTRKSQVQKRGCGDEPKTPVVSQHAVELPEETIPLRMSQVCDNCNEFCTVDIIHGNYTCQNK